MASHRKGSKGKRLVQAVPLETVRPEDVLENWLWEFVPSRDGRHWVKPVKLPRTRKFSGRLAGGGGSGSGRPQEAQALDGPKSGRRSGRRSGRQKISRSVRCGNPG
jgi:hypothetical protein